MAFKGSITEIVPHNPPMVLLDRFVAASETGLISEVDIDETSPFYEKGRGVPAYVGLEYIAQAISAFNGLGDYSDNKQVKPGFLLGSRKIDLKCSYFMVGQTLTISVEVSFNDGEMAVFDGSISVDGEIVVAGRVNAYQPENPLIMIETAQKRAE